MPGFPETYTLSADLVKDKIKGGWAGQTIGCTFGGPVEGRFPGQWIPDYYPIRWDSTKIKMNYEHAPGLYDDVYVDLTFVDVFEKYGMDAPADSFALAFARSEYELWHANQAGRYNILHGLMPPASGDWRNNPHSDCIDYQIESDFSGLMTPGMPNTAAEISDRVGHIMNSGDGWYGGVYVGAMYSLAFISQYIEWIVTEALNIVPGESNFHHCIADVIKWYHEYPDNWKKTWLEIEDKWSYDVGCPECVMNPDNIDAKLNCAYVVTGLLYGGGDFFRTMDIAMRCGQDADCNPATAAGITGTMIGYENIPEIWKRGLRPVEGINFKYTTISLNKAYDLSFRHALKMVEANGGKIDGENIVICVQRPEAVKL